MRNKSADVTVSSDMKNKKVRYEALVRAYYTDIYRYAVWLIKDPSIAQDIVQETFLRAWKSLDSLQDEQAAKAWLITILRRENARRFERKQFDTVDIDDVTIADTVSHSEDNIQQREVRTAIMSLSEEYREPLALQVLMGFSGDEIAEELNLNKNTVMTRLFRARNQLKEILTSYMNYPEQ